MSLDNKQKNTNSQQLLRKLPAVGKLLQNPRVKQLTEFYPFSLISKISAKLVDEMRANIAKLTEGDFIEAAVIARLHRMLEEELRAKLKPVVNGTGVVLHTNLGRALLSDDSVQAITDVARTYNNLELNLDSGKRGSRYAHVEELICELTGAEAALVVNNNASAVLLVLRELAFGGEVIVSRGEMVEIGGSFRVSEVMKESRAQLVEVGTTNKTHLKDYQAEINEQTKLLLKVHTSNFRIVGFTHAVTSAELWELGQQHDVPVYEDLGSGMIFDLKQEGIGDEPTVQDVVASGVDVVSFSGDKLLGGPQAGIIVGKKKYIERIKNNQLNRALRIDKFTVAALQATLIHYMKQEYEAIPTLRLLRTKASQIKPRADKLAILLDRYPEEVKVTVREDFSQVGGGALPLEQLPTWVVALEFTNISSATAMEKLRMADYPIMARVVRESVLLDVRTIFDEEFELVAAALTSVCGN